MTLQMFPYGNAQTFGTSVPYTFSCQHGKDECIGNMYEACAIEHYPTVTNYIPDWWPYVFCMEKSGAPASYAQSCATSAGLDWSVLSTCAGSNPAAGSNSDGNPLMYQIGQDTTNLQPPHQYTPWIVMNGTPLTSLQQSRSLIQVVCKEYTGTPPAGCS
jgi:interferon gamma-inducible protein 30